VKVLDPLRCPGLIGKLAAFDDALSIPRRGRNPRGAEGSSTRTARAACQDAFEVGWPSAVLGGLNARALAGSILGPLENPRQEADLRDYRQRQHRQTAAAAMKFFMDASLYDFGAGRYADGWPCRCRPPGIPVL